MPTHDLILAVGLVALAFVESIVMFVEGPPPPPPAPPPDINSEILRKRLDARRRSLTAPAKRPVSSRARY